MSNWPTKKLGEVCDFKNGLWAGKKPPYVLTKVIRNTNFKSNDGTLNLNDVAEIEVEKKQLNERLLGGGDLILERSGGGPTQPVGRVVYFDAEGRFSFSNFTSRIRIKNSKELDSKYLWRYLNLLYISGVTEKMQKQTTGIRNLIFSEYKELQVPLPPVEEQRKIVTKLEKVLEKIKEAKKLRKEAQTATDSLLAAELHKIFEEGKKKKWEEKELGKACDLYQGLAINAKSKHLLVKHSSLPLLRIKDLRENIEEQYVSEVGYPPDSLVNESDILYTRTGQVGLVFMGRHGILHNNCFKVIPRTGLDTKFLYWFLQEPKFKETIIRLSSRTAQPDITHKNFKIQKILIPPLTEQKKIVARLDALSNQIRILRQAQDQTASILYTLEQSVLHKAFNLT